MDEKQIDALKAGATLMYETLSAVLTLHDVEPMDSENSDEQIEGCRHCSAIAEAIVHYPCPTVQILLQDFTVEPAEDEETPAE
jgi:hypothetical protein